MVNWTLITFVEEFSPHTYGYTYEERENEESNIRDEIQTDDTGSLDKAFTDLSRANEAAETKFQELAEEAEAPLKSQIRKHDVGKKGLRDLTREWPFNSECDESLKWSGASEGHEMKGFLRVWVASKKLA